MTQSTPTPAASNLPVVSELFQSREREMNRFHATLLAFADRVGIIDEWICNCGRPTCQYSSEDLFTVHRLLSILYSHWDEEKGLPGEVSPEDLHLLRTSMLTFGEALDLFICEGGDPNCPKCNAHHLDTRQLLILVTDEWHGRAGCCQHMPNPEEVLQTQALSMRNEAMLNTLVDQMMQTRFGAWLPAMQRFEAIENSRWLREAKEISQHCLNTWIQNPAASPAMKDALNVALAIPEQAGFHPQQTRTFLLMMGNAFEAILVRDIAHADLSAALYEPIEDIVNMNYLRAHVATHLPSSHSAETAAA